jgi:predicted dehydrogenase
LRVGIAGLGRLGHRHAETLAFRTPGCQLASACSPVAAELEMAQRELGVARVHADFEAFVNDPQIDAVVLVTPTSLHAGQVIAALQAGKHVFVEKPPAMRAIEMDELVALAQTRDRVLMPGHLLLYHPGVLKLKELIASGELGDVLCVYGNRQNLGIVRTNENALWSLGVHDLSVILYLLDEDPEVATAQGRDFLTPGVEDVVFCFLRFPSGKIAHMHLSWLDPQKMRRMTVVGREKMAVFDDMELERKVTVYEKSPWKRADTWGEWQTRSGDIYIPKISTAEPLRLECTYFLELIEGRHDKVKVARDGARVVRALEMLTDSLDGR